MAKGATAPDRIRRSPAEVRQLLEDAGLEEFAVNGFSGTSTRSIADRAGVSESLLFRHYRTKAGLFQHTVVAPLREWISAWIEQWSEETTNQQPIEVMARSYVGGLYDLLVKNRKLLMALLTARVYDGDQVFGEEPVLSKVLDPLEDVVRAQMKLRGYSGYDPGLAVRFTFGMVLSTALLEEQLYPHNGRRPSREKTVDGMVRYMLSGLAHS